VDRGEEREFARSQDMNPWINLEKLLKRYVFIDLHEIFFDDFLNVFVEWI